METKTHKDHQEILKDLPKIIRLQGRRKVIAAAKVLKTAR